MVGTVEIRFAAMGLQEMYLQLQHAVYKATDGRVGHRMIGVPTLMLTTTGRRSGEPRINSLVYARDGDDYLLVASNGGSDRPPGWLYNVEANPQVTVQVKREQRNGTARVLRPSEPDYERLWQLVNANNHDRYTAYQKQTSRPIPVVAITPA